MGEKLTAWNWHTYSSENPKELGLMHEDGSPKLTGARGMNLELLLASEISLVATTAPEDFHSSFRVRIKESHESFQM